jgi:transglutaminase-like putative cysteine protease
MNYRLTITAAVAVVLASFSLFTVIGGAGWLYAGIGAVAVVAGAGLATRLAPIPAAAVATGVVLVCVFPLLTASSWPARIAGLAILVLIAASAGARLILPALADVATYLGALLIYLNIVFAGPQSVAWIIPTGRSIRHLGQMASVGYAEHAFSPPVPGVHGLELITAAGIGAIAILTDVIAVRLRSPAVAGLPLLVLFSVPVATAVKHAGVGLTLAFCLGITGYLALLAADGRQRLRLWGRLVTAWQDVPDDEPARGPDTRQLAASGRRIGLAAVAIAVVVPLILPSLKEHGIFGKSPGTGHGQVQAVQLEPLVQMHSQLISHTVLPVLTYQTTAQSPPQQYLQMYVLNYDPGSVQWTPIPPGPSTAVGSSALREPTGLAAGIGVTTSRTTITLDKAFGYKNPLSYLPLPYAPEFLKVPGSGWQESNSTLQVYAYHSDAGLSYTVNSQTPAPTLNQLSSTAKIPASIRQAYLSYPGPNAAQLLKKARSITKADHTKIDEALDLESYFTAPGQFTYTTTGNTASSVYQFLTTDRRGYCQQFAFSMAVLARLLGIPSRIAVGYTAGTYAGHHTWRVTTADAHAWPELYFANVGWVRFEPTPGGEGAQGTAVTPVYPLSAPVSTPTGPVQAPTSPVTGPAQAKPGTVPRGIRQPGAGGSGPGGHHGGAGSGGFPVGLTVALVALLLIVAPGLTRLLTRRRRWLTATGDAGRAHAAWRELTSDLADHGLSHPRSESPRALGRRVADAGHLDEPARQALSRITAAEERARYARTPADAESLRGDTTTVRRALARNVGRPQRWRARLLPASILDPVLAGLRQAPDAFGWLDAAGLRIRRTLDHRVQARRAG